MAPAVPVLADYPAAGDLCTPGTFPHRLLPGRALRIAHTATQERPETVPTQARNQGWADCTPDEQAQYRAAALARIDAWVRDEWCYIGVSVTITQEWGGQIAREIGSAAVWRVESDSDRAHFGELARDLFDEAEADVIALGHALEAGDTARTRGRAEIVPPAKGGR